MRAGNQPERLFVFSVSDAMYIVELILTIIVIRRMCDNEIVACEWREIQHRSEIQKCVNKPGEHTYTPNKCAAN